MLSCLPAIKPGSLTPPTRPSTPRLPLPRDVIENMPSRNNIPAFGKHIAALALRELPSEIDRWSTALASIKLNPSDYAGFLMGYEFEFASSVSRDTFGFAFDALMKSISGLAVPRVENVLCDGYHGQARGMNTWHVENDSSISVNSRFPVSTEFVTAPLTVSQLICVLPVISALIRVVGHVNNSCGLHFTVGHASINKNFDTISLVQNFDQEQVLAKFGRSSNSYCVASSLSKDRWEGLVNPHDYLAARSPSHVALSRDGKYCAINFNKLGNGLVELRAMGGPLYASDAQMVADTTFAFLAAMRKATLGGYPQRSRNVRTLRRKFGTEVDTSEFAHKKDTDLSTESAPVTTEHLLNLVRSAAPNPALSVFIDEAPSLCPAALIVMTSTVYALAVLRVNGSYTWLRMYHHRGSIHAVVTDITGTSTRKSQAFRSLVFLRKHLTETLDANCVVMFSRDTSKLITQDLLRSSPRGIRAHAAKLYFLGNRFTFGQPREVSHSIVEREHSQMDEASPLALFSSGVIVCSRRFVSLDNLSQTFASLEYRHTFDEGSFKILASEIMQAPSLEDALRELAYVIESCGRAQHHIVSLLTGAVSASKCRNISYKASLAYLALACVSLACSSSNLDDMASCFNRRVGADTVSSILGGLPDVWQAIASLEKELDHPIAYTSAYFTLLQWAQVHPSYEQQQVLIERALVCAASTPASFCIFPHTAHYAEYSAKAITASSGLDEEYRKRLLKSFLIGSSVLQPDYRTIRHRLLGHSRLYPEGHQAALSLYRESVDRYLSTGDTSELDVIRSIYQVNFGNGDRVKTPRKALAREFTNLRIGYFGGFSAARTVVSVASSLCSFRANIVDYWVGRKLLGGIGAVFGRLSKTSINDIIDDRVALRVLVTYITKSRCFYKGKRIPSHRVLDILPVTTN